MKKYVIALLTVATILNANTGHAQTKKTMANGCPIVATTHHHHYRHYAKKAPIVAHDETIDIDNPTATGTVEFRKGDLYINGRFVAKVANPKHDDYKVVLNYTAPSTVAVVNDNTYTGNMAERPLLGVFTTNDCSGGAIVENILPDGPADKAGLDYGDVISKLDGNDINNSEELVEAINKHGAGDNVSITYNRYGRTETTETKLANASMVANCNNNGMTTCDDCPGCYHPRYNREW